MTRLTEIELRNARSEIKRLRAALEDIRDIAVISDGVEFYAMLADKALNGGIYGEEKTWSTEEGERSV